jgi:hypothetical protein
VIWLGLRRKKKKRREGKEREKEAGEEERKGGEPNQNSETKIQIKKIKKNQPAFYFIFLPSSKNLKQSSARTLKTPNLQ